MAKSKPLPETDKASLKASGSTLKPKPTPIAPPTETISEIQDDAKAATEAKDTGPKKRGRPAGSKGKKRTEPPPEMSPESLAPLVSFPFDYLAGRRGPHWKLQPEEKRTLADLCNKVLVKYAGTVAEQYGAEIALTVFAGFIVASRVMADATLEGKTDNVTQPERLRSDTGPPPPQSNPH